MLDASQPAANRWKHKGEIKRDRLKVTPDLTGFSHSWLLTGEGEKSSTNKSAALEPFTIEERERLARSSLSASVQPLRTPPIVGRLKDNQLHQTEDQTMLPQAIVGVTETALVLEVMDSSWQSEGLNQGDMLIVERCNGQDCNGKTVVAQWDGRTIIRRSVRHNGWAESPATLTGQPDFKTPTNDPQPSYVVKSVVCARN